jgi:putative ABC transport system permease protein
MNLLADVRRALRLFRSSPGLVLVSMLSLGLGMGVNLALFSVIRAVFFYQPTIADPDRAIGVEPGNSDQFSYLNYRDLRDSGIFDAVVGYREVRLNLHTGVTAESITAFVVTANFFDAVRLPIAQGRAFGAAEAKAEAEPRVAVISQGLWRRHFDADPGIIGREVRLNGEPFTVIGVLPERYQPVALLSSPDIYVPVNRVVLPTMVDRHNGNALSVIAWLRPGSTREQAQGAVTNLGRALEQRYPRENREMGRPARVVSLVSREFRGSPARLVAPVILMMLFGLVLLSACANVAGLLLARAAHRQRELAVRTALGATRVQLIRMLLAESFTLAGAGTLAGGLLALWLIRMLNVLDIPGAGAPYLAVDVNGWLVAYALLLMLGTGFLCGIIPSWRAGRVNVSDDIQRGESHVATGRLRVRHAFVVGQVAACAMLLVLSSLMLRTLYHLASLNPGFDLDRGVVATVHLDSARYATDGGLPLAQRMVERVAAVPGVQSVAFANILPLGTDSSATRLEVEGRSGGAVGARTYVNSVSPGYFESLGIPMLSGRDFDAHDRPASPAVVIVSEALVRAYFPNEVPLGKRVREASDQPYAEIIGVVRDHEYASYGEVPSPILYFAYLQHQGVSNQVRPIFLHVRTGAPAAVIPAVRRIVAGLDLNIAAEVSTLRQAVGTELAIRRFGGRLLIAAGVLALLLAAVGLYGVMAFVVASRTAEIGVRMALGASASQVLGGVVRQGLRLVGWGMAIGGGLSMALSLALSGLVVGVSAADPISYAVTALVLGIVGAAASFHPARRAAKLDPLVALRRL